MNTETQTEMESPIEEQPQPQNNKIKLAALALVLLSAAAGGAYYFWAQHNNENSEAQAYEILADNESLADYEAFLEQYPDSPHAEEVKARYEELKKMYAEWRDITIGGRQRDFEMFQRNYPSSILARQCDIKIDSLDWVDASAEGTEEAVEAYLDKHPEGRYVSDAIIVKDHLKDLTASPMEKQMVADVIHEFYDAFGANDASRVFQCITPTMKKFLSKTDATKADVANLIERTYTEHILSCKFIVNNDFSIKKATDDEGKATYNVTFSVDQHITRNDEGKTFGSYTAEAIINDLGQLSSLTMKEVSRR